MTQSSLWKTQHDSGDYAELCNAFYQREINLISKGNYISAQAVQVRLKSLPYYISRTAHAMIRVMASERTPLQLDNQNASWFAKQSKKPPVTGIDNKETLKSVIAWYSSTEIRVGLVVPIIVSGHIMLDNIDRIDKDKQRVRTNVGGWFTLKIEDLEKKYCSENKQLLKPNKRIMMSACAGHCWQGNTVQQPVMPSLRELLLSCSINWQNFKKPLVI